jgi:hypothetical protein
VTKVFTTPRFQTAFDQVIEPLALPGVLRSGQARELTTNDCMARGVAVIGRFVASPALLGAKVRPTSRPVRVTARFRFDGMALDWWQELVPIAVPFRDASAPRLLLVRSQGKSRGAVLLTGPATGVVSFDLQPEELSTEGLFVFEVVSVDNGRPSWAPAASLGSIGVLLSLIEFTEVDGDREIGLVSTGNLPADPESSTLPLRAGYFVANPGDGDESRRWVARASLAVPPVPRTKNEPEPAPEPEPVSAPVANRPSIARVLKRRARRAARWVVPVAAVPLARRTSRRAEALKRRILRAAKGRPSTTPPPPPPPPTPVVPPGPPPNPLVEAMSDLASRNLVQVELVGIEPGPTPGVQVRAHAGAEIEIVTDGPLAAPALIRLSVDPSAVGDLLDIDDGTVRWDLVVRAGS